jgi:hypothetical protein
MRRPKKPDARKVVKAIKLTENESGALSMAADRARMKFGEWARGVLMREAGDGRQADSKEAPKGDASPRVLPGASGQNANQKPVKVVDARCARCKRVGLSFCPGCVEEVRRANSRA